MDRIEAYGFCRVINVVSFAVVRNVVGSVETDGERKGKRTRESKVSKKVKVKVVGCHGHRVTRAGKVIWTTDL